MNILQVWLNPDVVMLNTFESTRSWNFSLFAATWYVLEINYTGQLKKFVSNVKLQVPPH